MTVKMSLFTFSLLMSEIMYLFRGAATISQHIHELNSKLVFYCKVLIIDFFRSTIHYLHIVYEGKNLCLFTVIFEEKLDLLITNTGLMCAFVMTFMPNRLNFIDQNIES